MIWIPWLSLRIYYVDIRNDLSFTGTRAPHPWSTNLKNGKVAPMMQQRYEGTGVDIFQGIWPLVKSSQRLAWGLLVDSQPKR